MLHQFYQKKITALLIPVLLVSVVLPSQAKPRKAAPNAEAAKQFQIQASQATKIPAGSLGNFVVMFANTAAGPMTGLDVQEGKQVSLPVAGRVGTVELPQGSLLVGRFNRLNEATGSFAFDTLIANGKLYKINAVSAPLPGKLRQDLYDLQNRRDGRDFAKTGIKERREEQRGRAAREYSNAGGSIVGNFSPLAGSLIGGLGSIVGTSKETEAVENSTTKQEEILDRDIPSVLVAEISPLQNLSVQFNEAVDLNAPITSVPQAAQFPQGAPAAAPASNFAPQPSTTVPQVPVVAPQYPYGGYPAAPYGYPATPYGYPGGALP
jgi:hypothetical protein